MNRDELIKRIDALHKKGLKLIKDKNTDYSKTEDVFANFRIVEDLHITSLEKGIFVRITDKITRISNLIDGKEGAVKGEKLEDSLLDLSNYSMLLLAYLQSKNSEKKR